MFRGFEQSALWTLNWRRPLCPRGAQFFAELAISNLFLLAPTFSHLHWLLTIDDMQIRHPLPIPWPPDLKLVPILLKSWDVYNSVLPKSPPSRCHPDMKQRTKLRLCCGSLFQIPRQAAEAGSYPPLCYFLPWELAHPQLWAGAASRTWEEGGFENEVSQQCLLWLVGCCCYLIWEILSQVILKKYVSMYDLPD